MEKWKKPVTAQGRTGTRRAELQDFDEWPEVLEPALVREIGEENQRKKGKNEKEKEIKERDGGAREK